MDNKSNGGLFGLGRKRKKISNIKLTSTFSETAEVGSKVIINVNTLPEKFVKFVEATITDPFQRQKVFKFKKSGKGEFDLKFKPKREGKHIISLYARGKYDIFKREEIEMNITPMVKINVPSSYGEESFIIDTSKIKKRTWPSSSSYTMALQNPKQNISKDYEFMREGVFEKNPRVKYPTLIYGSGNFGTVFKLTLSSKHYAIKCFTRGSADLEVRYMAISQILKSKNFPFFTEFNYMDNAVRVMDKKETYFPVLMMSWVTGENLNQFINKNVENGKALNKVAQNLLEAVKTMVKSKIAHGDLSGDNILVENDGTVSLIDYDGMFVPQIAQLGASEAGHEAFQHPKRSREFDEKLDYFSVLLIYVTLLALAKKPELWRYNDGDGDKLIISGEDLVNPNKSEVLKEMKSIGGKVKTLTDLLIKSLSKNCDWEQISPMNFS
ncbi:MAG: protein kinase domain-containing protein [Thermoplasmataceae archaeon]